MPTVWRAAAQKSMAFHRVKSISLSFPETLHTNASFMLSVTPTMRLRRQKKEKAADECLRP